MAPVTGATASRSFRMLAAAIVVTAACLTGQALLAQTASPSALKAAFLFNFAKFAEWPALPADAPVRVCVAGDELVAGALADAARGHAIAAHAFEAVALPPEAPARGCQVLFVGSSDAKRAAALLSDATAASSVLTVSDAARFAQNGGMVELFVEDGRMKFAINVDAVQRSRVRLSSRLLGLARIVRDQSGSHDDGIARSRRPTVAAERDNAR
jgi:uncharacterized protein DUF4154